MYQALKFLPNSAWRWKNVQQGLAGCPAGWPRTLHHHCPLGPPPHTPPESKWECLARQLTEPSFLGGPGLYGYPRTSPCSEAGPTEPAAHTTSRHLLPLGTPNRAESHIQP